MSLWRTIREDATFVRQRDPAATSWLEVFLAYPGLHARELHRLAYWCWQRHMCLLARLISHVNRGITGVEIHPGAVIGAQCFIDHGMGVVIGETTIIGDRCHLHQGVTLGGTSTRREKRHPTLGNDVTVGAGAQLIGAITIGDGARIGAGSVVVANVPPHAAVVGVPGHVVSFYDPGDDTVLRLPDPEHDRIDDLAQRVREIEARMHRHEQGGAEEPASEPAPPSRP